VVDTIAARNATASEVCAPYKIRLNTSRPDVGSTPRRKSLLMPPNLPSGTPMVGSILSMWNSSIGWPNSLVNTGARNARTRRMMTTMPPPIATLSRLSRRHAICRSDRPAIAFSPMSRSSAASAMGVDVSSVIDASGPSDICAPVLSR
jgi:hypothetical protein